MTDGPLLIDLEDEQPSPADAPPVADIVPKGQAMLAVASIAARPRSRLWAWLWRSLAAVLTFLIGVALWTFGFLRMATTGLTAQARGRAGARIGRRATFQSAPAPAMSVPATAMPRPAAHQTGRICNEPSTVAP